MQAKSEAEYLVKEPYCLYLHKCSANTSLLLLLQLINYFNVLTTKRFKYATRNCQLTG